MTQARRVTAICHESPDADTIGAALAIALVAQRLGKPAEVVSVDRPSPVFSFLPGYDEIRQTPGLEPDLAVLCDAATLQRVGRIVDEHAGWFAGARILNIDHHVTNSQFGAVNLVDPGAAATCELVADLLPCIGMEADADIASALLAGIVRDSHGFSDPATSSHTLRVAADLVDAGASLSRIQRRILGDLPFATIALWGRMLDGARQAAEGRIVYAVLTEAMLAATGTQQHDADGLVEFLARAERADVTILLREIGSGGTRVSVRTTEAVDATAVVAPFGGGGHARRAGVVVDRDLDDATASVVASAERLLRS